SEWVSLVLEKKNTSYTGYLYWLILPIILLLAWLIMKRKKKRIAVPPASLPHSPAVYSESIQKVIQYIAAQYQDPELSRTQLASQVFLSEKYLSTLFKKEVGENLATYVNKYRIERAVQLLKETRLSISEIAFQVGYNSVQNFNKNFKIITRQSPSEQRKQV
ncbi:MAG: AraC family transcriptional regulator, partial [Chitinophagaceae bacterium]